MMFWEKKLSAHPTDILTPYLLFTKVLLVTVALKDSSIAMPASPLSWT